MWLLLWTVMLIVNAVILAYTDRRKCLPSSVRKFYAKGRNERHASFNVWVMDVGTCSDILLLLHGFPTSSYDWSRLLPFILQSWRVIAFDMLGFGMTDRPPAPYRIEQQADIALSVLARRKLTINNVCILAHDYGCTVAQEIIARSAVVPLKTILLNGGIIPEAHRPTLMQRIAASAAGFNIPTTMTEWMFRQAMRPLFCISPTNEEYHAFWAIISNGRIVIGDLLSYIKQRESNRDRWVAALAKLEDSLYVAIGLDDPVSGIAVLAGASYHFKHAHMISLRGIGHYPHWETPAKIYALLPELEPKGS